MKDQKKDHHGQGGKRQPRHEDRPFGAQTALEPHQADGDGSQAVAFDEHQGEHELVPAAHRGEQGGRDQDGPAHGKDDPVEDRPGGTAVDVGGVLYLPWERQHVGPDQEGGEGDPVGDVGNDEGPIGVVELQPLKQPEERDQANRTL